MEETAQQLRAKSSEVERSRELLLEAEERARAREAEVGALAKARDEKAEALHEVGERLAKAEDDARKVCIQGRDFPHFVDIGYFLDIFVVSYDDISANILILGTSTMQDG